MLNAIIRTALQYRLVTIVLALVITGDGFDGYLSRAPGWTVIRRTPTATLYRRAEHRPMEPNLQ